MAEHALKTASAYFDAVARGDKTFEVRINDRGYQRGDTLRLFRWDKRGDCVDPRCQQHHRNALVREVAFVYSGDPTLRDVGGVAPGWVVLGLTTPTPATSATDTTGAGA